MSISGALANALSGLTAASRSGQVVSDNVANAATEAFGRREIALSSRALAGAGAGVQVDGVVRVVDQGLLRDRRLSDAELGLASDRAAGLVRIADLFGDPDAEGSVAARLRTFEGSLIEAGSRPDQPQRLANVLGAATALAGSLQSMSDAIQADRLSADRSIARQVAALNEGLARVEALNGQIAALNGAGRDVTGLEDARQKAIDGLASIVPLREVPRDDGRLSLYTSGGAILLDDTARTIGFSGVNAIAPDMTLSGGALSGLTIDGRPVSSAGRFAPLGGGSLEAAFEIRDAYGPGAQARIDAFARDLVDRFAAPGLDPTVAPGAPGLFTDGGQALDPADEIGLAGRIAVNAAVDPSQGGAAWRLRDGLGAAAPGETGNPALLNAFADALASARPAASATIPPGDRSAVALWADLASLTAGERLAAEAEQGFAATRQSALRDAELRTGVDTDQELQKLLLIEQSYAANARVIQTVDAMISRLLEL